jgi:cytochrome c oxidase cbb3-type subunit 3
LLSLGACDRPPSADSLRPWTPTDHDRVEESAKLQAGKQGAGGASAATPSSGSTGGDATTLVEATWKSQCFVCHGPMGRGDGPNGPMVNAGDLTRADWQAKVKDEEIASTIRNGKGKMPKFDLPDTVVMGLVARIRSVRGK